MYIIRKQSGNYFIQKDHNKPRPLTDDESKLAIEKFEELKSKTTAALYVDELDFIEA